MNFNLIDDFLKLHNLPSKLGDKITNNIITIIIQYLKENQKNKSNELYINIGIGDIIIINEINGMQFKFIPSEEFVKELRHPNKDLINILENKININMLKTYKDFM